HLEREKSAASNAATQSLARKLLKEFDPAINNLVGATGTRLQLLKLGEDYLAGLKADVNQTPELLLYEAEAHERLGEMMSAMFEKRVDGTALGVEHLNEARRLREQLAARSPDDIAAQIALASCALSQAGVLRAAQKDAEAQAAYDAALKIYDGILANAK